MERAKTTVAILSTGDMGVGIGKLLSSHGFRVITNATGRSDYTIRRAQAASIELLPTDLSLVTEADYLLSIVPPRDATAIATRIRDALKAQTPPRTHRLIYVDLNAISPATCDQCVHILGDVPVRFIDGGIIGGPPKLMNDGQTWYRPSIPTAGPRALPDDIAEVLNARHLGAEIGKASGLKMCFASLTKGFQALAIQSFTSAETMGILPELKRELSNAGPGAKALGEQAERGLVTLPPKAYRWVREMDEIAGTFAAAGFGGREEVRGGTLFNAISEVYRFVAEDTSCGKERAEERKTTTADEVVADLAKSLKRRNSMG